MKNNMIKAILVLQSGAVWTWVDSKVGSDLEPSVWEFFFYVFLMYVLLFLMGVLNTPSDSDKDAKP